MTQHRDALIRGFKLTDREPLPQHKPAPPKNMWVRHAGDGTYKVVSDGQTLATGFDNHSDAEQWINDYEL